MAKLPFPERLRRMREARGIGSRELSLRIGRSPGFISLLETGTRWRGRLPSHEDLAAIAEAFDVTVDELVGTHEPEGIQDILDWLTEFLVPVGRILADDARVEAIAEKFGLTAQQVRDGLRPWSPRNEVPGIGLTPHELDTMRRLAAERGIPFEGPVTWTSYTIEPGTHVTEEDVRVMLGLDDGFVGGYKVVPKETAVDAQDAETARWAAIGRAVERLVLAHLPAHTWTVGGVPDPAAEWIEIPVLSGESDTITVPRVRVAGAREPAAFLVPDAALIMRGIVPGDYLLVDRAAGQALHDGQIVVARLEGAAVARIYSRAGRRIELRATLPAFLTLVATERDRVEILGVYAGLLAIGPRDEDIDHEQQQDLRAG